MNFKRVAALLLAGAMVMTAVPVYAKGDDVTLSVSIWDTNQEPGIKEILADFTEKTGIKTEISVVKWDEYWTMLEAGAQGGSLPDVFWMHSNVRSVSSRFRFSRPKPSVTGRRRGRKHCRS